jgi:flagellar motor switch/type III secretory pathway protein FliN
MATSPPLPPAAGDPGRTAPPQAPAAGARRGPAKPGANPAEQAKAGQAKAELSLAPVSPPGKEGEDEPAFVWPVANLPVELDVVIPVRSFRVRTLLALAPGHVIETRWSSGEDMPLAAGPVQLAWSEFEVIDTQLAVRITRLA